MMYTYPPRKHSHEKDEYLGITQKSILSCFEKKSAESFSRNLALNLLLAQTCEQLGLGMFHWKTIY